MRTNQAVRDDRYAPVAVGLTIALVAVWLFWAVQADDDADPFLPALLLAANGVLLAVRPVAYFVVAAPRWFFRDGERGEPSVAFGRVTRVVGALLLAWSVATVVVYQRDRPEQERVCGAYAPGTDTWVGGPCSG